MSVRIRMQTSFSSTDYEIGGDFFFFCMVQLVGVLYITATVVHSIQTLKWQTVDICLDTLFWEGKQGYVLGPLNGTECPCQLAM